MNNNRKKAKRAAAIMKEWLVHDGLTTNVKQSLESLVDGVHVSIFNPNAPPEKHDEFKKFMRAILVTAFQIGRYTSSDLTHKVS